MRATHESHQEHESAPNTPRRRHRARDLLNVVGGSIGFDAVAYYDETRGLSPEVQSATARLLAGELPRTS
jgi:hypothetical protein